MGLDTGEPGMTAKMADMCLNNIADYQGYTIKARCNHNVQSHTAIIPETDEYSGDENQTALRNSWGVKPVQRLNAREKAACEEKPSK